MARQTHRPGQHDHRQFLSGKQADARSHVVNESEYRPQFTTRVLATPRYIKQLCSTWITLGIQRVIKSRNALTLRVQLPGAFDEYGFALRMTQEIFHPVIHASHLNT